MAKNYELAQKDYEAGMKYKDISAKYDVSLNTVKSWKSRYWNKGATPQKSVHTKAKKVAHKIIDELVENDKLTDKQKAFCMYYLQRFNATWAYMQAYGTDYETSMVNGNRLLRNAKVQSQLTKLKKSVANDNYVTASDVAREYAKQAFSDIGDYVDYESKQLPVIKYGKVVHDHNGDPIMYDDHHVRAKPQSRVDTSLIKGVHIERGELVLELYDKVQALDHLNKLVEDSKLDRAIKQQQLEKAKAEAKLAQAKVDLISGAGEATRKVTIDKFLDGLEEALNEEKTGDVERDNDP